MEAFGCDEATVIITRSQYNMDLSKRHGFDQMSLMKATYSPVLHFARKTQRTKVCCLQVDGAAHENAPRRFKGPFDLLPRNHTGQRNFDLITPSQ